MIFPGRGRGLSSSAGAPQYGGGDDLDLSEDEPERYESARSLLPSAPLRSPAPSLPTRSPIPLPPAYAPPPCPYPALPYTSYSDPSLAEDLELF